MKSPRRLGMTFGERLKNIRKQKGLSQEQLALKIGLQTKAAVSKIEKGITNPNQSTICKLAVALGINPQEFFSDTPLSVSYEISKEESFILEQYRNNPKFKKGVDNLIEILEVKKNGTEACSEMA